MFVPIGFDRNALEYCRDNEAEGARDDDGHSDEAYDAKFPAGKDPQVESKERNLCEAKDGLVEELEEPEVLNIPLVNRCSSKTGWIVLTFNPRTRLPPDRRTSALCRPNE